MDIHDRNATKHEYEVQAGSSHETRMVFVGNTEKTAISRAVEILDIQPEEDHVRLYHTHPSPGPVRRYAGIIKRDGTLRRPV